jgi:hypothetical protein
VFHQFFERALRFRGQIQLVPDNTQLLMRTCLRARTVLLPFPIVIGAYGNLLCLPGARPERLASTGTSSGAHSESRISSLQRLQLPGARRKAQLTKMHADSEKVRNPLDTAALPPLLSARHSPERAPFLSFWPVSPEMRDGAVNQTCADFDMETNGSPAWTCFELLEAN